jgi:hypothetical protein
MFHQLHHRFAIYNYYNSFRQNYELKQKLTIAYMTRNQQFDSILLQRSPRLVVILLQRSPRSVDILLQGSPRFNSKICGASLWRYFHNSLTQIFKSKSLQG